MPCPLVGRTKLSHRIWYFFIWRFVAAYVTCSNSEWGYRGFLWAKGTPKYISKGRMSENRLKQDVRILQFMHQICGTFCVRRYQQFCTLMVNGNAYNQNSLSAVTQ